MKLKLRDMRLQHRIFMYFSMLIIVSTILFGYYAYRANVRTAEENFTSAVKGAIAQTADSLENVLMEAEQQVNLFAGSHVVQNSLAPGNVTAVEQYDRYMNMQRVIEAYEKYYQSFGIRIFLQQPRRFMNDNRRYFTEDQLDGEMLFRRNSVVHWSFFPGPGASETDPKVLTVYRKIISGSDISLHLGTVAFDVKKWEIASIIDGSVMPGEFPLYLFDAKGRLIFASGSHETGTAFVDSAIMGRIREAASGSLQVESDRGTVLTVYRSLRQFPFYLAVNIPYHEITNQSKQILYQFVGVALLVLAVSFVFAYLISSSVTRRIKKLIHVMNTLEGHDFNVRVPTDRNDEIGILTHRFNWMIERIRMLIEDVYKSNYEKKEAELKLLQAQINPHFLYNTLDSVHWMAVKHRAPEISYMVRNLSNFFRLGLRAEGRSTLGEELKHIEAYYNIQKYRFEDRVELETDVPDSLRGMEVLPLILQPLVENAMIHGILKHENLKGKIRIRAWLEGDRLHLEVSDNGTGMGPERLERVIMGLESEPQAGTGTGLRNVHRRIRFRYDGPYGLSLYSSPNEGTRCVLVLPAIQVSPSE